MLQTNSTKNKKKVYGGTLKCYLFGFIFDIFIVVGSRKEEWGEGELKPGEWL